MVSRNPYLEPIDDDTTNRPNPIDDNLKSAQSRRYLKIFAESPNDENSD